MAQAKKVYNTSELAFQTGDFHYTDCWKHGFIAPGTNNEKPMTALTLRAFAESLADQNLLFGKDKPPIRLLETGIGDGSSTARFLKALEPVHPAGWILHASDLDLESLTQASENLANLQYVNLRIGSLQIADAFKETQLTNEKCQLFIGSHCIYSAKHRHDAETDEAVKDQAIDREISQFLRNVMDGLDGNGIAILYHDGAASGIYGPEGIGGQFGNAMTDAPERIARLATNMGKQVASTSVPSKQYFPKLDNVTVESFKDLNNWKNHSPDSPEGIWLKKFLFALDNLETRDNEGKAINPGGAIDLHNRGTLAVAIEATKELLERKGYMPMLAQMQVLYSNPELKSAIGKAILDVESKLPSIQEEADRITKEESPPAGCH